MRKEEEAQFDEQFGEMLNFIEAQTGESEREKLKSFISEKLDLAYKRGYDKGYEDSKKEMLKMPHKNKS